MDIPTHSARRPAAILVTGLVLTLLVGVWPAAGVASLDPLSLELRGWLDQHGPVRVGWARGIEPVAIWDGDEAVGGFGVAVWDLGAAELGIEVEHVPFDDITSVVDALRDGDIDVAGTHAARPDLLEFAEMSAPNAWERLVLTARPEGVPPGGTPLPGQTVTTVAGSALAASIPEVFAGLEYVETPNIPAGVAAVAAGEIDYYYNGLALLGWYAREEGVDLVPVGDAVTVIEIGSWAVQGSRAAQVSHVVRDAVTPAELALLHSRWTGFDLGDPTADDGLPSWFVPTMASLAAAVVLLVAFALILRRRVRAATRELQQINDDLEAEVLSRTAALRDSNRALKRFASTAAHDLKGPVTAIAGLTSVLESIELPASERTDLYRRIRSGAERLSTMVDAMLEDAIRMGVGAGPLDGESFEAWLREVTAPELSVIDGELRVTAPGGPLDVDPEVLRRTAINLVGNAAKYATNDTGTIIEVRVARREQAVELTVDDNGPGIPRTMWGEIFDLGSRLVHDDRGFGLGLSAVRDLVQGAGGSIAVGDAELGGARFTVTLPTGGSAAGTGADPGHDETVLGTARATGRAPGR